MVDFIVGCFSVFTGRREFVQRLKLEATLNVHDGCVSIPHLYLCICAFTFYQSVLYVLVCAPSCNHATFPQWVCEASVCDREQTFDFRPGGWCLWETWSWHNSHTSCHTISQAVSLSKTPKQQLTSPRRTWVRYLPRLTQNSYSWKDFSTIFIAC